MRYFLGVGRYTPNAAVYGEMAWEPPMVKQWGCLANYWSRLSCMRSDRLNKRIAQWASRKASVSCKNWFYNFKSKLSVLDLQMFNSIEVEISKSAFVANVKQCIMSEFTENWVATINRTNAVSGRGRNKLRTYRTFKQTYDVEKYCLIILPPSHRSAFCKFRCGVAPIRIETGRYENLSEEDRKCPFCRNIVEDEAHVILDCPIYEDFRPNLFLRASDVCNDFIDKNKLDQLNVLFTHPSLIRICAKTCFSILKRRTQLLCK